LQDVVSLVCNQIFSLQSLLCVVPLQTHRSHNVGVPKQAHQSEYSQWYVRVFGGVSGKIVIFHQSVIGFQSVSTINPISSFSSVV
jgi:hypothetical protein